MSDAVPPILQPPAVGRAAFTSLRAESEPWLQTAFISPDIFEAASGMRSVMIFGDTGSGKTALHNALFWQSIGPNGYPSYLVVQWTPKISENLLAGSAGVTTQIGQIFDDCALAVAQHVAAFPDRWVAAPDWARNILIWFVQKHSRGNITIRLGHLREHTTESDAALDELVSREVPPALYDDAPYASVTAELAKALAALGLDGIWIVADGLERYLSLSTELVETLASFLSALTVFERSQQIAYKLFIPRQLEHALRKVSASERRRIDVQYLTWSVSQLKEMIEKRLALATCQQNFNLADLCSASGLLGILEAAGGTNPRGWLEQIQPLFDYYLLQQEPQPIDETTWITLREKTPPAIIIDEQEQRVFVGNREIPPNRLTGKNYEILLYLYEHSERIVSTAELYFCAYLGQPSVPKATNDNKYASPKDYDGTMDTLIYRLRQAIEPDPSHPVLLVTIRGRGVQLKVRW